MRPESTTTLSPSALPTDFASAVREFLDYLQGECGLADNTAAAYRRDLSQFGSHLTDAGVGSLVDVTPSGIEGFLRAQSVAGKAASSVARALAAVRMFCRFCVLQRKLREDPSAAIDPPHQWERLPHTLSDPAARMLLDTPCGGEDRHWRRDRAILTLLYAAGLRASELAGAAVGDVNFELGVIRVLGKGMKERVVPVAEAALEAVREYLSASVGKRGQPFRNDHATPPTPENDEYRTSNIECRSEKHLRASSGACVAPVPPFSRCRDGSGRWDDTSGYPDGNDLATQPLFASRTGRAMRREDVFRLVRKYVRRAALRGHVSPHTFRHAFATQLLAGGADLRSVQEMLGHADIATTQIYTHVDVSRLKAVHRKFHPRG